MAYDFSYVGVLVVESTREMYNLFKDVLRMLEVPERNIEAAFSCEEGYQKFVKKNHDLIITDWLQNPDRGVSLTKMIRTSENSPNPYVPIIMTAGSGHYSRVITSRDAGVSDYLVKPFAAADLAHRIARVIEHPRPFVICAAYAGPDRRVRVMPFDGPERRKENLIFEQLF